MAKKIAQTRKDRYGERYMSEEGYESRLNHLKEWSVDHNPASQNVRCIELDMVFDKLKDAANYFGYTYSTFCEALRNGNSYGGYTWERSNDIVKRKYHYNKDGTSNMKPIKCVETGEIFQSAKDLAQVLGVVTKTANDIALFSKERQGKHYAYIDKGDM